MREYKAPEFRVQSERAIRPGQVAQADTRVMQVGLAGDSDWKDKLVSQLAGQGSKMLEKLADVAFAEEYLEGQAAAGLGKSEADLGGNPLTRDWRVAGHRDTMGKLALADAEVSFAQDLAWLRKEDPDSVKAYLADRREKLLPLMESMSREARAAVAGQLLMQDRNAIAKWSESHQKWIAEERMQAQATQFNTGLRSLVQAQFEAGVKGSTQSSTLVTEIQKSAAVVYAAMHDPAYNDEMRKDVVFSLVNTALNNDAISLYEYLNTQKGPDGVTLLSKLSMEQQEKLGATARTARERNRDRMGWMRHEELAKLEAQIQADASNLTYEQVETFGRDMLMNGYISPDKYRNLIGDYVKQADEAQVTSDMARAYMEGRTFDIFAMGGSMDDAAKAFEAHMQKRGVTPAQLVSGYMQAMANGAPEAARRLGVHLGPMLQQMRSPDGQIQAQHVQAWSAFSDSIRRADDRGATVAREQFLSALGEADRAFAYRMIEFTAGENYAYPDALRMALEAERHEQAMPPGARAAAAAQAKKDAFNRVTEIEPMNGPERAWGWFKSLFGGNAEAAVSPQVGMNDRDGWLSDTAAVQRYTLRSQNELRVAIERQAMLSPGLSGEDLYKLAVADLSARTVKTRHGPVFLPPRAKLQAVLGIAPGRTSEIGQALDDVLSETKPNSKFDVAFENGRFFVQELDPEGRPVGTRGVLDPAEVRKQMDANMTKRQEKAMAAYGPGTAVQTSQGPVRVNGANTAGVRPDWMVQFRQNLVKNEGVLESPREDKGRDGVTRMNNGKPVMTGGIGVSSTNRFFEKPEGKDGKYTPAQIERSFRAASNHAANIGIKAATRAGVGNAAGFQLMSELAWQSGDGFMLRQDYQQVAAALRARDAEKARAAFMQTPAYKLSGDERRSHYLSLIDNALKGR